MAMARDQVEALTERDVHDPITPEILLQVLGAPPFVPVPELISIRDLVAIGVPQALDWLSADVKRVFDIRTLAEREKHPDPEIEGVVNTWFEGTGLHAPPDLNKFVEAGGESGVRKEYLKVLDLYRPTFRAILEHARDKPHEPFLFHCTAGRDRTGVMSGLLQSLAGTGPEDARFDYMLSRIGIEPAREQLLQHARGGGGVVFNNHPGFCNMCSLRTSCWDLFVAAVQEEHGGWEGYVLTTLGFSSDDLARIKTNLSGREDPA
ncbi:hypothetical protein CORC01_09170 [Colletotrichum orchidophilum]|uniref:Tyrosine specific protein phosphatases domain-containing protein n=1 Tax=Colletotrichum orchidophilum TaxID=1209926 RepID=A0A1G4B2D7_9PEZI|nr:uncharacterized protein CORC01_09170 [Colletotrichum orchidophilum]OHE95580.1 hypothetical protein CORC01_09170 [Colletotrichum orchidophilum]